MALGLSPTDMSRENLGDASWWGQTLFSAIRGG